MNGLPVANAESGVQSEGTAQPAYKTRVGGVYTSKRVNSDRSHDWAERLYHQKAAQLVLYGRALGLSHAEAEDVLHDTFSALLGLGTQPARPEHYVVRSFRNRALNYRRRWWRRITRELEARRWFEPGDPVDPREQALARALTALPVPQREVIVLRLWHVLSFAAIGELQGISANTAAGRYRYGLERLRRTLTEVSHEFDELADASTPFAATAAAIPPA